MEKTKKKTEEKQINWDKTDIVIVNYMLYISAYIYIQICVVRFFIYSWSFLVNVMIYNLNVPE